MAPAIAIWHTVDHLWGLPEEIRAAYEVRQFGEDRGWETTQVYIRRDRAAALGGYFKDWPVVDGKFHQSR